MDQGRPDNVAADGRSAVTKQNADRVLKKLRAADDEIAEALRVRTANATKLTRAAAEARKKNDLLLWREIMDSEQYEDEETGSLFSIHMIFISFFSPSFLILLLFCFV